MGFAKSLRKGWGSFTKRVIKPVLKEAKPVLIAGRNLAANTLNNTSRLQDAGVKTATGLADTLSQPIFIYVIAGIGVIFLLNKR